MEAIMSVPFTFEKPAPVIPMHLRSQEVNAPATPSEPKTYAMSRAKRAFDMLVSGSALLALSPLLLGVAAVMKITMPGPVFYRSKRVGTGWEVFDLIKFRTMDPNADQKLGALKHLNMYEAQPETSLDHCEHCASGNHCSPQLMTAEGMICENLHKRRQEAKSGAIFKKFKDDPRVTPFGRFMRNTSIDELPQLINIFRGDMSLVGNRPLPVYEAERLTTDRFILRFSAPAGLTGLWQVTKRGTGDMSEEERIALDNDYALNGSFLGDLKLMLKTIPAVFQSENV